MNHLEQLERLTGEIVHLGHVLAMLHWDQETQMPPGALEGRAEQNALIEGLIHDRMTNPEIGEQLDALGVSKERPEGDAELDSRSRALAREVGRSYRQATQLPRDLVTEMARQTSINHGLWVEARKQSDFSIFRNALETSVSLVRQKIDCIGFDGHPYDPLLDEYEPAMRSAEVEQIFTPLGEYLADLVARIRESGTVIDTEPLTRPCAIDGQAAFGRTLLQAMGYEFEHGRVDVAPHPFATTLGPADVRLTTRYDERLVQQSIFGTIHEGGHGLYEQGIDPALGATVLQDGTSLGIHESQSRLWENMIGRSLPFWQHFYPSLQTQFPDAFGSLSVDTFHRGINAVRPSFIRVEADEVTYSLHIILRFELEKALVDGSLDVADAPEAWRIRSEELFGIRPEREADGVLQDIHWSELLFGYFPTYALGNLYAAQFMETMRGDIDVDALVGAGDLIPIREWLRDKIHRHGRIYPAGTLCERVTGAALDPSHFSRYLEQKYSAIYRL